MKVTCLVLLGCIICIQAMPEQETTTATRLQRLQPIKVELRKDDKKCGEYFVAFDCHGEAAFHYMVANEDSPLVKLGKDNQPVLAFHNHTKIVLDDTKKVPTVEHPGGDDGSPITSIIRLSARDYEKSKACLPLPSQ